MSKYFKNCFLFFSIFHFIGCAAALVPESSSPRTKINQATILFNQNQRPVGAVTLLKQAVPLAQRQNDKRSEADAEFYLGEIYRSPGRNGGSLKNPREAVKHHQRAILLYNELNFYKSSAFVSWNMATAYEMIPNQKKACGALRQTEKLYKKTGVSSQDKAPVNETLLKSVQQRLKKNKC